MVTWLIMLCSIMIFLADGSSTDPQSAADPPILRYAGQRIVGGTWGIVGQFRDRLML